MERMLAELLLTEDMANVIARTQGIMGGREGEMLFS